jgi:hypothetical protein
MLGQIYNITGASSKLKVTCRPSKDTGSRGVNTVAQVITGLRIAYATSALEYNGHPDRSAELICPIVDQVKTA